MTICKETTNILEERKSTKASAKGKFTSHLGGANFGQTKANKTFHETLPFASRFLSEVSGPRGVAGGQEGHLRSPQRRALGRGDRTTSAQVSEAISEKT